MCIASLLVALYASSANRPRDFQFKFKSSKTQCEATQVAEPGGFGSQYQNIIQTALYAEWKTKSFCVTPITFVAHNYDGRDTFVREINEMMALPKLSDRQFYCLFVESCQLRLETNIYFIENKKKWFDDFIKVKEHADFAKPFLQKIGRTTLSHLRHKTQGKHAVVHIRRPNPHDYGPDTRNHLNDLEYCYAMRLVQASHPGIVFSIYSQGVRESFELFEDDARISLHLNEALNATFSQMVRADVLIMARSSLSYTAGLLSEGEVWGDATFYHTFPYYWKTFERDAISPKELCLLPAHEGNG